MKRICDRCKAEVEYTNNGKKVTGGCNINIGIDKIKGKYFLCMPCTAEFVDLWDKFYKSKKEDTSSWDNVKTDPFAGKGW